MKTYSLINGKLELTNSLLKISYRKFRYVLEFLKFLGSISLISIFIEKMQNFENLNNTWEYIKTVIFGIASLYLIYLFFCSVFKKVWINKLEINDLVKIIINKNDDEKNIDEDSKIEVILIKSNGRKKKIDLQKEKNQLTSFLEEIKKKNSRLKIEFIVDE